MLEGACDVGVALDELRVLIGAIKGPGLVRGEV